MPEYRPSNEALQSFWGDNNDEVTSFESPVIETVTEVDEPVRESAASRKMVLDDIQTVDDSDSVGFDLNDLLETMLNKGASDLHLTVNRPPMIRVSGDLTPIQGFPSMTTETIRSLLEPIMEERQQAAFSKDNELDFAYSLPGRSRFRVNMLRQQRNYGAVLRAIPNEIKTTEQLGLPDELNKLAFLPRGLVLVTGPTGSGKSTTLAAIIDRANRHRKDHIITVEDPIEFVHEHRNSIVTQREIGVDTSSFAVALRAALREDPDIILIGELRDLETISAAITAAETGHLVFGTLHTQSAAETISRIIDVFPEGSKDQVRQQLGATVQGIVCQTLVKNVDGGRVAATEFMKGISSIKNLVRKGQIDQISSYIQTGSAQGMHSMDQDLEKLVRSHKVRLDTAAEKATNYDDFLSKFGTPEQQSAWRRKEDQRLSGPGQQRAF